MKTQFRTTFIGYPLSYHRRYMFTSSLSIWGFYGSLLKINVSLKCLNCDQLPTVVQLLHLKDFFFCILLSIKLLFIFYYEVNKKEDTAPFAWRCTKRLKWIERGKTFEVFFFPTTTLEGADLRSDISEFLIDVSDFLITQSKLRKCIFFRFYTKVSLYRLCSDS